MKALLDRQRIKFLKYSVVNPQEKKYPVFKNYFIKWCISPIPQKEILLILTTQIKTEKNITMKEIIDNLRVKTLF